jgi:hypothetical protein
MEALSFFSSHKGTVYISSHTHPSPSSHVPMPVPSLNNVILNISIICILIIFIESPHLYKLTLLSFLTCSNPHVFFLDAPLIW